MAVDALMLGKDDVVADIGAGLGYISFQLVRYVEDGKVVAVDVQPEMLALLEEERDKYGVTNIETVLGTEIDPNLPEQSIDIAVMFDAYHDVCLSARDNGRNCESAEAGWSGGISRVPGRESASAD